MSERAAFRITPDLRFLYPQPAHEAAFATLVGAIRNGIGLALIDGEVGTGKSILLRRIEAALKSSGRRPRYIPYPGLSVAALLDWASSDSATGRSGLPAPASVLLLDDAEHCSNELLSGLHDLVAGRRERPFGPQVVLVGGTSLWARMLRELPRLAELVQARVTMSPLSPDETSHYVRHRLGVAGRPVNLFSPDAMAAIAQYSRGVPRLVNQVCARALLLADIEQASTISQQTIAEAVDDCPAAALFEQDRVLPPAREPAGDTASPPATAIAPEASVQAPPTVAQPPATESAEPPQDPTPLPPSSTGANASAQPTLEAPGLAEDQEDAGQVPASPAERRRAPYRRKDGPLKFKAPQTERAANDPSPAPAPASPEKPVAFSGFVPRHGAIGPKTAPADLQPATGEPAAFSGFKTRRAAVAEPARTAARAPALPEPRRWRSTAAIVLVAAAAAGGAAVFAGRTWPEATERALSNASEAFGAAAESARGLYAEINARLRR